MTSPATETVTMNNNVVPPDQPARDAIAFRYGDTLFVEAGAGNGKTEALVGRVINLVKSSDDVSLDDVAVITFTNRAAAELPGRPVQGRGRRDHRSEA